MKNLIAVLLASVFSFSVSFSQTPSHMKVHISQQAPDFQAMDVSGKTISLSALKGKKVLLTFYRNVGCPVCNFRFHELEQKSAEFQAKNTVLIAVYESSREHIEKYLAGESVYPLMIPDPQEMLYKRYDVDKSMGKVMKGMFHGAMGKMKAGKKLFKKHLKQDGNMTRIGADFLIDETGKVIIAHYGAYLGDHIPLSELEKAIQ